MQAAPAWAAREAQATHTQARLFCCRHWNSCSYMLTAQAEVTSLWNPHNNSDCSKSVGCFCIKNIYFMLRLLWLTERGRSWGLQRCRTGHRIQGPSCRKAPPTCSENSHGCFCGSARLGPTQSHLSGITAPDKADCEKGTTAFSTEGAVFPGWPPPQPTTSLESANSEHSGREASLCLY